jgi:endoglucanase
VVSAIRQVNRTAFVIVPGDGWSNAHRFDELNGQRAWIQDPAGRVVYEAHCYFDADASGKYQRSFASELRDDPHLAQRGAARLRVFIEWCRRNQVEGFVGELGIPGDDTGWQQVMAGALREIDSAGMSACYWAAGEWWNDYPLSVQPRNEWRDAAPQEALLRKYLASRGSSESRVSQQVSHLTLS